MPPAERGYITTALVLIGIGTFAYALVKYIVGESENFSNYLFLCFSSRFAEDLSPKSERSEIRCQFVLYTP